MRVGFNLNVLGKFYMPLIDVIRFIEEQGVNALELSFRTSDSLLKFKLTEEVIDLLGSFEYFSIHAPFIFSENSIYQDDEFTRGIVLKLREFSDKLPVKGIVFHPINVNDFGFLDGLDLPMLIENMDIRKDSFRNVEDIKKLKEKYEFGFVLEFL